MSEQSEVFLAGDFRQRYLWSVYLRYAAAGLGFALGGYAYLLGETTGSLLLLVLAVTVYNLLAHFLFGIRRRYHIREIVALAVFFQVLDLVAVSVLIAGSGGLESPYWFLYLVLMVISGFGPFSRFSYIVLSMAAFSLLFYLGLLGLTINQLVNAFGAGLLLTPQTYLKMILERAVFTLTAIALFAATVYYFSKLINQNRELLSRKNRELLKTMEELKDISRLKDEFIANVSHELRTPLAVARENLSLVEDKVVGEINEKQRYLLAGARVNLDDLRDILNSILDTSKLNSGTLELRRRLTDINILIWKAVDLLKDKAQGKTVAIETILPERATAFVDPDQLLRVFVNLIDNAIKYSRPNGKMTIGLELTESEVKAYVLDNGIGIDEHEIPLLFERFVRSKKAEAQEAKGMGLGLSICKGIVELHHGKIWAESQPERGAKFIFTLPRIESNGS